MARIRPPRLAPRVATPAFTASRHQLREIAAFDAAGEGLAFRVVGVGVKGTETRAADFPTVEHPLLPSASSGAFTVSGKIPCDRSPAIRVPAHDGWTARKAFVIVVFQVRGHVAEPDDFGTEVAFGGSGAVDQFVRC